MAINKAMKLALSALSYADIDIKRSYKFRRKVANIRAPIITRPLYKLFDRTVVSGDREVAVRLYTPDKAEPLRTLLFFHGGGWVTQSVDTYNKICINLARRTASRVISVEYSLAPENKFPHGLEDCYAVARELALRPEYFGDFAEQNNKIILVGDSAGGNLAAALSLLARDRGEFLVDSQVLIYPATYNDYSADSPFQSVSEYGKGYLLTAKKISEYMQLYMNEESDLQNPYFAPLLAEDFKNQPNTLIITAEYDPLRDEGEE